jgi:hypothetical protein
VALYIRGVKNMPLYEFRKLVYTPIRMTNFLGRGIVRCKASTYTEHKHTENVDIYSCLDWNSNLQSQCQSCTRQKSETLPNHILSPHLSEICAHRISNIIILCISDAICYYYCLPKFSCASIIARSVSSNF